MRLEARGVRDMSRLGKPLRWRGVVMAAWYGCVFCLSVAAASVAAGGEEQGAPPRWKTGAAFQQVLNARVRDAFWSAGTPLRHALSSLARAQQIAIMLDRRIDPGCGIELSVHDVAVRDVLERLAAQCDAAPAYLDGVVYVGPRLGTSHLAEVASARRAEVQQLPRPVAQRLGAVRAWRWDDLAEPRALLDELAREADVTFEGSERVPHDLWPALDLPALPWTDRATLVLAGFGLTFACADDGHTVQLVPLPEQTLIARDYPATLSSSQVEAVQSQFPQATIDARGQRVVLEGTREEHERLERLLQSHAARRPSSSRSAGKTVFTLKVTGQPVEAVLETLARQLGVTFAYDAGVEERLGTRVSFDVHEVPLPALLDATLTPAGLSHRQQGEVIVVSIQP